MDLTRCGRFAVRTAAVVLLLAWSGPTALAHKGVGWGCRPQGPFGLPGLELPPDQIGSWGRVHFWPELGTHLNLLHTGKVLFWKEGAYLGEDTTTWLWDPATDGLEPVEVPSTEVFCAGHVSLGDGRILAGGGSTSSLTGIRDTNIFDPRTETWTRVADMTWGRYYSTLTLLPDGRVVALSGYLPDGLGTADIPEIYDPASDTWTELPGAATTPTGSYGYNFVGPDGNVVFTGPTLNTQTLDLDLGQWVLNLDWADHHNVLGANALYRPGKVMKVGGVATGDVSTGDMVRYVELIDLNAPAPQWVSSSPTTFARGWMNLVILPDGKVLMVGGATGGGWHPECAVHAPEMWDPNTQVWTQVASHQRPREYHSSALLLPDGRVLMAGGENQEIGGEKNYEIYSPPYLFRGPRPTISWFPKAIGYGDTFTVTSPAAAAIGSVALTHPGTVTHQFDESQRYVPLAYDSSGTTLTITAPPDSRTAPPGYYMLFLVDDSGVPSVGEFVLLGQCTATHDTETLCADASDNDCDGLIDRADLDCGQTPLPFAPSGFVPDGLTVPGAQLRLAKVDEMIRLDWAPSCQGADLDYAIYEGDIGDFSSHVPVFCSTNGATTRTFDRLGDKYYLVVPQNGIREGGYGFGSSGEREPGAMSCLPQESSTCD